MECEPQGSKFCLCHLPCSKGSPRLGAVQTRPWEGKWINVRSARMLSSVMDAGFARIMNKHATKGTETRSLQLKQISKSFCTARVSLRSKKREQKGQQAASCYHSQGSQRHSVPFFRMVQVLPAWGCRGVRGWHQASMSTELWQFNCSWEKVSKAQTKQQHWGWVQWESRT